MIWIRKRRTLRRFTLGTPRAQRSPPVSKQWRIAIVMRLSSSRTKTAVLEDPGVLGQAGLASSHRRIEPAEIDDSRSALSSFPFHVPILTGRGRRIRIAVVGRMRGDRPSGESQDRNRLGRAVPLPVGHPRSVGSMPSSYPSWIRQIRLWQTTSACASFFIKVSTLVALA